MWCFSVIMFLLALMAIFRGPKITVISPFWFLISWLPGELPWAFGVLQAIVLIVYCSVSGMPHGFILGISVITLCLWFYLHKKTYVAQSIFAAALQKGLGVDYEKKLPNDIDIKSPQVIRQRNWLKPFTFARPGVECIENIAYGTEARQRLDIYRPAFNKTGRDISSNPAGDKKPLRPVLLHVHGGAWIIGHKKQQAQPLIRYLAQQGWICVDINYHLAPSCRFPACIIDVKRVIVWLKDNIAQYGGDPEFIVITGGSAGGHLCALAALTPNHPEYQPGFEHCDTQVQAAVPVYGVYDFTDVERYSVGVRKFLEKYVMPVTHAKNPDFWRTASPLFHTGKNTLPMFIIHGDKDCLVPVEQARQLAAALQRESTAPVLYAELPGAQHAFEIFHGVRAEFHIEAVGKFLHYCYGKYVKR